MSITLSRPPAIVQEVREWAEANGTSLNLYVRDCLEAKCAELAKTRKTRAQQFLEFAKTHQVKVPKGWKWSREEATERKMRCLAPPRRQAT